MVKPETYNFGEKNYYPWMLNPGRNWESGTGYRYSFNGKENDDEIAGNNNTLDFGARVYDCRIGKWLSIDPEQTDYPHTSTYAFVLNNPITFIDPDGKKVYYSGGATFDPYSKKKNFHTKYLKALDEIICGNYYVMKEERMKSGIDASHWAELHASMALTSDELQTIDNQEVIDAVEEINSDLENVDPTEPINLIGSSYGSVLMAQAALVLANDGTFINSITLTGSPISKDSPLYQALEDNLMIGEVIYIDAEDDPVVESGGVTPEEGEEAFQNFTKHPFKLAKHLQKSKDKNNERLNKVINEQLIEYGVEGNEAIEKAEQYLMKF